MKTPQKPLLYPLLRQWYFLVKNSSDKDLYQLAGMKRSGNHVFLNWLLAQLPGITCFNNNLGPLHPAENTLIKKAVWNRGKGTHLVISSENKDPEKMLLEYNYAQFGNLEERFHIILLRDPYNWLASYCAWTQEEGKRFREDENHQNEVINIYKAYARMFTEWQQGNSGKAGNCIAVNFNKWVSERDERQQLAEQLKLPFTDKGRLKVDKQGGGSSFSGTALKGDMLKVLERYKQFSGDSFYCNLLDDELREIGWRLFELPENTV